MKPAATPNLLSISSVQPGPSTNPLYVAGQLQSIWAYSGDLTAGTGSFTAENTGGTTLPLYGVWVAPDGVAFAVGQETALKRSSGSWAPITGPATAQVAYNVWGTKTGSAYTVYCVGNEGRIWHSNGGNFVPEMSGTTNALFARRLPRDARLTVVTASPEVALALCEHERCEVVMPGGRLNPRTASLQGPEVLRLIESIRADLCVLGVCAISAEAGVTCAEFEEQAVKQAMVRQSVCEESMLFS